MPPVSQSIPVNNKIPLEGKDSSKHFLIVEPKTKIENAASLPTSGTKLGIHERHKRPYCEGEMFVRPLPGNSTDLVIACTGESGRCGLRVTFPARITNFRALHDFFWSK